MGLSFLIFGNEYRRVTVAIPEKDPLDEVRLISTRQVRKLTGWSDPTLWRRCHDGSFPPPRKDCGRNVWFASEVYEALKKLAPKQAASNA